MRRSAERMSSITGVLLLAVCGSVAVGEWMGACGSPAESTAATITHLPPVGYTEITDRDFSSKAQSRDDTAGAQGWDPDGEFAAPLFTVISDASAPRSAPLVGQMRYSAGFAGGDEPALLDKRIDAGYASLYIDLWLKLSPNWYGHPTGVNKILFIWMAGNPKFVLSADGEAQGVLRPSIRIQDSPDGTPVRGPNVVPTAEVVRGAWQHWQLIVTANTPGIANGAARWWIDGRLASDYRNIDMAASAESPTWQIFQWAPTWGGVGGVLANEQFMWWDHVYLSGK